jgi:HK97 family phage portal protein
MGMFDRLFGIRATAGIIGPPRDPVVAAWFGQGSQSSSGMNVTPDTALTVTAVYRAVSLLAQTYASLPLGVYKLMPNGGSVLDIEHPLQYILTKRPNKWQTSFEWREMSYAHFALRGRCYSEIISTGGKSVSQLIPLHPDRVRPFRAPDGKLAFEYSPLEGSTRIILQDEMQFMHGLTVGDDGITPLSPISAAGREAIGNALATQEHSGKLFANGTRLGGLLKMPGHLADDTKRKGLLDGWNRAFGGTRNTGKTALLEDGLDWQALGMTSEDAQLLETLQFSITDIARIFGVPPHLLAELSRATFGNIEEQGIEFVTHTVRPGAIRREEALERDLLFGRSAVTHCIKFDLDGLMRGNMAARAAYNASGLQNGYLNRNEVRVDEGRNPVDDPKMNEYTIQLNMQPVSQLGAPPLTNKVDTPPVP